MRSIPHILLLTVFSYRASAYGSVLNGLSRYRSLFGPWQYSIAEYHEWCNRVPPENLIDQHYDGILIFNSLPDIERMVLNTSIPSVAVVGDPCRPLIPTVTPDDYQIGVVAARHLMRGYFDRFGFIGGGANFSRLRQQGFSDTIVSAGYSKPITGEDIFGENNSWMDVSSDNYVREFIAALTKPIAVMACNDILAALFLQECRKLGLRIPHDVAVLGVDNVLWYCETSVPSMSSIDRNLPEISYQAAVLLDKLMTHHPISASPVLIPPLEVIQRQSTEMIYLEHPDLDAAIRFIRDHACDGITIDDVEKHVLLSRRSLHRLFSRYRGNSPGEEIRNCRLEHAVKLLLETNMSLAEIAAHSGFNSLSYLGRAFQLKYGQSPSQYRSTRGHSSDKPAH